ncbi:hypothetical protein OFL98_28690, partial [Escherichia coli]|nr:hypothetical protein [Escherichia coli]
AQTSISHLLAPTSLHHFLPIFNRIHTQLFYPIRLPVTSIPIQFINASLSLKNRPHFHHTYLQARHTQLGSALTTPKVG